MGLCALMELRVSPFIAGSGIRWPLISFQLMAFCAMLILFYGESTILIPCSSSVNTLPCNDEYLEPQWHLTGLTEVSLGVQPR